MHDEIKIHLPNQKRSIVTASLVATLGEELLLNLIVARPKRLNYELNQC